MPTPKKPAAPTYAKVAGRKLEPLYDRLIVERIEAVKETDGGIVIPDEAQEKPGEGTVLSCGPGRLDPLTKQHVPMQVKVGDRVLFGKYAGMEILFDDEQGTGCVILREEEILCIEHGKADLGVRKLRTKKLAK